MSSSTTRTVGLSVSRSPVFSCAKGWVSSGTAGRISFPMVSSSSSTGRSVAAPGGTYGNVKENYDANDGNARESHDANAVLYEIDEVYTKE